MKIIDNLLNQKELEILQNSINLNSSFPWYYTTSVSVENINDGFYFTHNIYSDNEIQSNYYKLIKDIFKVHLKWLSLIKCKVNLFPSSESLIQYGYHQDQLYKHKDAIFYLNTNDGYTVFKNGTKIESKQNRLLLFENNEEHSSTNCTNDNSRFNINFNYF